MGPPEDGPSPGASSRGERDVEEVVKGVGPSDARRSAAGRELIRGLLLAVALVVLYYVLPLDRWWVMCVGLGAVIFLGLGPFIVRRLRRVLTSEHPLVDAAVSLVLTLTILVTSFAALYYAMAKAGPGQMSGIATRTDALYFVVTMVSTVGFGDITAVGQTARAIVTINMVLNLVFIGITLRLLTWAVQQRRQ